MWRPRWFRLGRAPKADKQARPGSRRDRLAVLLALATAAALVTVFFLSIGTQFLMPGPLASAHGAIKTCSTCHTKSGSGKLSWVHGLAAGDPLADSKACLTCHKMPDTAFNAHSAPIDVLKQSTGRLTKTAAGLTVPHSARAQSIAFPTEEVVAGGLTCALCHQEHQGSNFKLNTMTNAQCRSCHVVKFDSFDRDHPKFDTYPFRTRTRIVYDHAGHFGKHYPELAKKDPAKRIPETCSTCHNSRDDKRIMTVAPFEQTCATCHLDQITGKERVSGPKGIAFLSLPGLDLETLKLKNAAIGEWPDGSEAELTPFMKVMIGRNEQGVALIKAVDGVNLQDLSNASDGQITAVTNLVWEIKRLVHALISGKASDVLADLKIVSGAKLSAPLVADLTASIPRDVVISAVQQWLPNLAKEIASGPATSNQEESNWSAVIAEPAGTGAASPEEVSDPDTQQETSGANAEMVGREAARTVKRDPPACAVRVFGQCLLFKEGPGKVGDAETDTAAVKAKTANGKTDAGKKTRSAEELPGRMNAGAKEAGQAAEPAAAAKTTAAANAKPDGGEKAQASDTKPPAKTGDQSDELLFPTEEELREINARNKDAGKGQSEQAASKPNADAPAGVAAEAAAQPQTTAAPVITIDSDVDPESWADYGGWYRQDYAIFYRPIGHKDKFIYSWLFLTGPQAPKGTTSPAAAVFDFLTSKDAQGSCTKCHSIDDLEGKGRAVNFSPASVESKKGRFTNFIHEPHFGIVGNSGCLTCHKLEKDQPAAAAVKTDTATAKHDDAVAADAASKANAAASAEAPADENPARAGADAGKGVSPYLKSYEQSNPHTFASEFSAVKKDLCQTCHTRSMARQDCLTCHKYHVNGVNTPITNTKLPAQ